METTHRLHEGDRVRIRNEVDPSLYLGMSTIGNEGVIRAIREDRFDLPQVYIEWDKNHWTYNGAPDCWTFEEHFDIIESMSMDSNKSKKEIVAKFADLFAELMADEPEPAPTPPSKSQELRKRLEGLLPMAEPEDARVIDITLPSDEATGREAAMEAAQEVLADSEAFVLIAVSRVNHPKAENGVMMPFAIAFAENPVAELLATVHMSGLANQAYQDLVLKAISKDE